MTAYWVIADGSGDGDRIAAGPFGTSDEGEGWIEDEGLVDQLYTVVFSYATYKVSNVRRMGEVL